MYPTINLCSEEREELLDGLVTCVDYLREEAALAAQCFDDLGGYCPDDLRQCEPLDNLDRRGEIQANLDVLRAITYLDIEDAEDMACTFGGCIDDYKAFWANPIRCDAKQRARVMKAIEDSGGVLLDIPKRIDGYSVREYLSLWMRRNFKTPYQFARQAKECELKSYLVGAVGSLSSDDIENLLSVSLVPILQDAAALARVQRRRDGEAPKPFTAIWAACA